MQRLRSLLTYFKADESGHAQKSSFCCNGRAHVAHIQQAGSADTRHSPRSAFGGVSMDLKNNIKVMGTFQKVVNSLYAIITAVRVIAVVFLVLQAVLLIASPDRSSLKYLK